MNDRHPDAEWITDTITALERWTSSATAFPTSQLTGGGAVASAEQELSRLHGDRPVLLVPSATYGMRSALLALGVGPDDEVIVPALDWPATVAAVRSLGARPVVAGVDPATLTIDPEAAALVRTARTSAAVACHLLGVPADVPALRRALPGVPVVEDCAQALGSRLDGAPVGTLGDLAVHSFGPGKRIDVGEAGAVVSAGRVLHDAVVGIATHPLRQLISGLQPNTAAFLVRVHPIAAVLLHDALGRIDLDAIPEQHRRLSTDLERAGLRVLGADRRRGVAAMPAIDPWAVSGLNGLRLRLRLVHVTDIGALLDGRAASRQVAVLRALPPSVSTDGHRRTGEEVNA